jgi:hypothetical protein
MILIPSPMKTKLITILIINFSVLSRLYGLDDITREETYKTQKSSQGFAMYGREVLCPNKHKEQSS